MNHVGGEGEYVGGEGEREVRPYVDRRRITMRRYQKKKFELFNPPLTSRLRVINQIRVFTSINGTKIET